MFKALNHNICMNPQIGHQKVVTIYMYVFVSYISKWITHDRFMHSVLKKAKSVKAGAEAHSRQLLIKTLVANSIMSCLLRGQELIYVTLSAAFILNYCSLKHFNSFSLLSRCTFHSATFHRFVHMIIWWLKVWILECLEEYLCTLSGFNYNQLFN